MSAADVQAAREFVRAQDQHRAEVDALHASNRRLLKQLSQAKAGREHLIEAVYRAAQDAALAAPRPAPIAAPKKTRPGDHWALLHLTDWQRGKRTRSYSSEIADQRVEDAVQRALRLTDLQRHAHGVSSVAVLFGGDMIEGTTIFPTQPWEVDASIYEQLFGAASLLERVVRTLLGHFDRVEVWEEAGNHGRLGRRGEQPAADNVDLMAYRIARDRIGTQKRLVWHPLQSFYAHGTIGAYHFLLVHGDEVRSFGGNIPAFGILRKSTAWATGVTEPFKDVYMGHWHMPGSYSLPNGGRVFLTGSTESGSEYAREFVAATGQPSQRLHFIDPEAGRVAAEYVLWLD
jgi:hypothetical protein